MRRCVMLASEAPCLRLCISGLVGASPLARCAYASSTTYSTAEAFLSSLINYEQSGIPNNAGVAASSGPFQLDRMYRLLAALGNPQSAWPTIHIAGSKGKGSTATMLSYVLQSAGYRVGLYTSPHMHHLGERIAVNNSPLDPDKLDALVESHKSTLKTQQEKEGGALTHFEVMTALAFRHFADAAVDIGVIETGMGGTNDATNVFTSDTIALSVITPLGYEHVEALGGSIESIARAKAGIMKAGRPVVIAKQPHQAALDTLVEGARERGCPVIHAQDMVQTEHVGYHLVDQWSSSVLRETVRVHVTAADQQAGTSSSDATQTSTDLDMRLVGPAQQDNIQTAMAACLQLRQQGWKLPDAAVRTGLQRAWLPGRMQLLRLDTSVSSTQAAQHVYLLLDGAHSPESASNLASTVRKIFPSVPVALVVAMAQDKEHRAVLGAFRQIEPCTVVFTNVNIAGSSQRAAAPGYLLAQWDAAVMTGPRSRPGAVRCRQLIQASLQAAIERAIEEVKGAAVSAQRGAETSSDSGLNAAGLVIVTGSLHAVAAAQRLDTVAQLLARAAHMDQ